MGGITIKNPGSGRQAFVSTDGQLLVQSESLSLQHFISRYNGQAYQVSFINSSIASGTNVVGHVTNNSANLSLVASYVRSQAVGLSGGTALGSNTANYFSYRFGRTYASGGTLKTAVNMNRNSGNAADISAYDSGPTLAGTAVEFDRIYVPDSDVITYNKEGSLILGAGDTLEMAFISDNTAGTAVGRLTFMMMDLSDLQ